MTDGTYSFQVPKAVSSLTWEAVNDARICHSIPAAPIMPTKHKEQVSEMAIDQDDQDQ